MSAPKIAIIHDWLTNLGGAERVVFALHEAFPDAPIYTSVYEHEPLLDAHTKGLDIRTTWLQKLPRPLRKLHKFFPLLRVKAFQDLDLSEFDIIITSSSAESKQVRKTRPDQVHICYCHTPIRYYWNGYEQYKKDPGFGKLNWLIRLLMPLMVPPMRRADYEAAQQVDVFIANSAEVQRRIKQYYHKPSTIIHPSVEVDRFTAYSQPQEARTYYLAHGRQVPYKRVDLAVKACSELGLPLIVSGGGPDHDRLKSMAGPSVSFEYFPTDERVNELFGGAKGYIFPAEEDFGIVMVEALSAGTPVIAYAEGGSKDIVNNNEAGLTFDSQTTDSLKEALLKFETMTFPPQNMQRIAKRFHKTLFIQKIRRIVISNIVGDI